MTNASDFLQQVEREVLERRAISRPTCEAFADLPPETRASYAKAMRFLSCESADVPSGDAIRAPEANRIRASRLMLLKMGLDGNDPRWSSWMLDRLLEAVVGTPGGGVGDLLHALHGVLGEYSCALTEPVRNLIKDLVIKCFTEHRASYGAAGLGWMVEKTIERSTPAQAYLALHAIPPDVMQPRCSVSILQTLVSTPYWGEAVNTLSEDLSHKEAQELLGEWLAKGIALPCRRDVERILGRT